MTDQLTDAEITINTNAMQAQAVLENAVIAQVISNIQRDIMRRFLEAESDEGIDGRQALQAELKATTEFVAGLKLMIARATEQNKEPQVNYTN